MILDEMVRPIKFLGIQYNDWSENISPYSNHHYFLVRDYISDACDCNDTSQASDTLNFIYPFHISKVYFIEGRIEGEITVAASGATSTVTDYRCSLWKINIVTEEVSRLATTEWRTVNDTLAWDSGLGVGDEAVYHFWIELLEKQKIEENEFLMFRVEVNGSNSLVTYHQNAGNYEDIWVKVPMRF